MRYLLFAAIVVLLATTSHAETPWEDFLNNPTPANASRVTALTYTAEGNRDFAADLQILQNQVLAQDREAFRLAVRLYQAADGGDAEDLGVLLGRTARSQPKFFLREVAALDIRCLDLSSALTSPGLEYVDRTKARTCGLPSGVSMSVRTHPRAPRR
jgi:formate-dependent phosphoribosylglycinamide formyltransferase (GAR transformylase)